jgi:hypothetical protein
MSTRINLSMEERFPKMRPMGNPPTLMRINGCGVGLYGRRDFDAETSTYVKTYCLSLVFLPVLALGAYRVADADRGWYFFGKEPLSFFARTWNKVVAAVALFAALQIGWTSYTSSEAYKTSADIELAAKHLKASEPLRAAGVYRGRLGGKEQQDQVRAGLKTALEQCLQSTSMKTLEGTYRLIAGIPSDARTVVSPDAFKRGLAHIEKFRASEPESVLDLFEAVKRLEPKNAALPTLKIDLLKGAMAAKPDNTNRVVELALLYEEAEQLKAAQELLLPYKDKLGATEGARILGQHLLSENRNEDAYQLLYPYVQKHLEKLHAVERAYTNASRLASSRALADLNAGRAGHDFGVRYKQASRAEQDNMVGTYIRDAMNTDPSYKRALAELQAANKIVHVTLDLGIVQLNRAQNLRDSAARKSELEAAEKTFLAIGGLAGDTDEYRLFLGQVYYWLGKSTQGKELFDLLLADRKRAYEVLMPLSKVFREVGEDGTARSTLEEAYRTARDDKQRWRAASARAHVQTNSDDQIAWLRKSDLSEPTTQIALANALGEKALADGDKNSAATYLRKAIAGYDSLPHDSAATLNNWGLCHLSLYYATGNIKDHERGLKLLEDAVAVDPGNSTLLKNTLHILLQSALNDVVHERLKLENAGESADFTDLAFLYDNEAERTAVYQKLGENPKMKKTLAYLDKALLLSPKEIGLYRLAVQIHGGFQNKAEIQRLQQRAATAQLDLREEINEAVNSFRGAKDKDYLTRLDTSIARIESTLQKPAVKLDPALEDYLHCELNRLEESRAMYGGKIQSAQLVDRARASYERQPNVALRGNYAAALLFRAHEQLIASDEAYARLARQSQRALVPSQIISVALDHNDATAAAIRKNPSFAKALELYHEQVQRMPGQARAFDWALLKESAPKTAASIAQHLASDDCERLCNEVSLSLSPLYAHAVLEQYWTCKSAGDSVQATTIYRQAIQRGLPLPEL